MKLKLILFLLLFNFLPLHAGWLSIEGRLARVEFTDGHDSLALHLLRLADEYLPELYLRHGLADDLAATRQVRIILNDLPDIANGFAVAGTVVIYARSSSYLAVFSEDKNWYELVLKHELAHNVTFRALERRLSLLGLVFSPDVPRWFYEGLAQYFAETWNTRRGDIYLREAALNGRLDYTSLDNLKDGALLYAGGNAFVRYLATTFGDSSLIRLLADRRNKWYYDFDEAFEQEYKKPAETIFQDFVRSAVLHYGSFYSQFPQDGPATAMPDFGSQMYQLFPADPDSFFLALIRENEQDAFTTLVLLKKEKAGWKKIRVLAKNINTPVITNPDNNLLLYGRQAVRDSLSLPSLSTDWFVYSLAEKHEKPLLKKQRSRYAAFTSPDLVVFSEVSAGFSRLRQLHLPTGQSQILAQVPFSLGQLTAKDSLLIVEGQENSGQHRLFQYKNGTLQALPIDLPQPARPMLINDSMFVFTASVDFHPQLYRHNLNTGQTALLFNDDRPFWMEYISGLVFGISTWDAGRHKKFYEIAPADSAAQEIRPLLYRPDAAYWKTYQPQVKQPEPKPYNISAPRKIHPQFSMEHLLTLAYPAYDPELGWSGIFTTGWFEPLGRQYLTLLAMYSGDFDRRWFVSFDHQIAAGSFYLETSFYQGPVFFTNAAEHAAELNQRSFWFQARQRWNFTGRRNWRFIPSAGWWTQNYYGMERLAGSNYSGPRVEWLLETHQPTTLEPAVFTEYLAWKSSVFAAVNREKSVLITDQSLSFGHRLFGLPEFGFRNTFSLISQFGQGPTLPTTGIDRYYQFDLPRDGSFSRAIRGYAENISSRQVIHNSFELNYVFSVNPGWKLFSLDLKNVAVNGFAEGARVKSGGFRNIFSSGIELSAADTFYRMAVGLARVNDGESPPYERYYLRLSLWLEALMMQSRPIGSGGDEPEKSQW